ncbi:MAG: alpha/beta hydrolase, partial [Muribaculaceae bacterium]|nr:alpha/beta hydrolase [Muribaculaceae bacterium]
SVAGMVVSGKETLLSQNRYFLTQGGYSQQVVDEYCKMLILAFDGDKTLLQELESSALPAELKQNIKQGLLQLNTPYLQYFLALDMRGRLADVACPVLALNGTKDTQVFYEDNLGALRRGLPSNVNNKIVSMDGLNHLLQHCTTGSVNEYGAIEETISPDALEAIVTWVKSLPQ